MTFRDAQDVAIEFGAKVPALDHTSPAAGCWIDRIKWLPRAAEIGEQALADAIEEATGTRDDDGALPAGAQPDTCWECTALQAAAPR